jgi:predicted ATP-dependent endonuclease of OLD family
MTIKVDKDATKEDIIKTLRMLEKNKKLFDARDFIGKIKFRTDMLELQRDLR